MYFVMIVYLKGNFGGIHFCQHFYILNFSYVNTKYPSRKIVQYGIAYTISRMQCQNVYIICTTHPYRKTSPSEKGLGKVRMKKVKTNLSQITNKRVLLLF